MTKEVKGTVGDWFDNFAEKPEIVITRTGSANRSDRFQFWRILVSRLHDSSSVEIVRRSSSLRSSLSNTFIVIHHSARITCAR